MSQTRRKFLKLGLASLALAGAWPGVALTGRPAAAQSHQSGSSSHHSDHVGGRRQYRGGRLHGGGGRHMGRGKRPDRSSSHGDHTVEDTVFHHEPPDDDLSDLADHHTDDGHDHTDDDGSKRGPMYRGG